jgi:hypothetical protein
MARVHRLLEETQTDQETRIPRKQRAINLTQKCLATT